MLTAHDLLILNRGTAGDGHHVALRYLEARAQSSAARVARKARLTRPYHDLPLLTRMLDGTVEDCEAREARALAALEASPLDSWSLGGGVGLVRVRSS